MVKALETPAPVIEDVLRTLERTGLLARMNGDPRAFLPARDFGSTLVSKVVEAVRRCGEGRYRNPDAPPVTAAVEPMFTAMDTNANKSLADLTIYDLLDSNLPGGDAGLGTGF